MTLPTDYIDGDVLTAADVNAITTAVNSNTDLKIAVGTFNAKGDLLVGLTNDSVGVLTAGTNGYFLSANSSATEGVEWVPASGKVLQIASDSIAATRSTTNTTNTDISGVSLTFVPLSTNSSLLIEMSTTASVYQSSGSPNDRAGFVSILDGSDTLIGFVEVGEYNDSAVPAGEPLTIPVVVRALISNTTTSSRVYKGSFRTITDNTILLEASGTLLTVTEYAV
jgi:hypothetical protein